jgi:hypothetical protein
VSDLIKAYYHLYLKAPGRNEYWWPWVVSKYLRYGGYTKVLREDVVLGWLHSFLMGAK